MYSIILRNVHVCHDVIDDVMTSPVHVVSIKLCIKNCYINIYGITNANSSVTYSYSFEIGKYWLFIVRWLSSSYDVIVRTFVVINFWKTFSMLFPTYNSSKKNHKTLSWNLFRVKPYFDWSIRRNGPGKSP